MLAARRANRLALSSVLEFLGGEWYVSDTGRGKEPKAEKSRHGIPSSFDLKVIRIIYF